MLQDPMPLTEHTGGACARLHAHEQRGRAGQVTAQVRFRQGQSSLGTQRGERARLHAHEQRGRVSQVALVHRALQPVQALGLRGLLLHAAQQRAPRLQVVACGSSREPALSSSV